jgi:hypothetical protein
MDIGGFLIGVWVEFCAAFLRLALFLRRFCSESFQVMGPVITDMIWGRKMAL